MKKFQLLLTCVALVGCDSNSPDTPQDSGSGVTITPTATDSGGSGGSGTAGTGNASNSGNSGNSGNSADATGTPETSGGSGDGPKFDVGDGGYCKKLPAGVYCDGNAAVTCGDMGNVIANDSCLGNYCLEGTGCVECLDGQFDCQGDQVMECNAAANPPVWQQIEICDAASSQVCSIELGTCTGSEVIGGSEPTGVYYQFAFFDTSTGLLGSSYDVDGLDDRLYVTRSTGVDVFQVALLDSDADGIFEPNQHPDNPDETGPIEERTLTFVETIVWPGSVQNSTSELFVTPTKLFMGGNEISEYDFATAAYATTVTKPAFIGRISMIAYDEYTNTWYGAQENARRVFQYDVATASWGLAFDFPDMSGSHMDGIEVVTDPNTGTQFVYVSDMTSDFIGQYRKDPNMGWVQENLFQYDGTEGSLVEGMGFGPINHFWATGGANLYELGGGDLADFTEPPG